MNIQFEKQPFSNQQFKNKEMIFFRKVLYPKQFSSPKKFTKHLLDIFYPLYQHNEGSTKVKEVAALYLRKAGDSYERLLLTSLLDGYNPYLKVVESVWMRHNPKDDTFINWRCFTHLNEVFSDDDYKYIQGKRVKGTKLMEYQFIAQKIVHRLWKSDYQPTMMTNSYFKAMGRAYSKYTERKFNARKLAHILKVLQKYEYFHVEMNSKGQRVIQIGKENPYYQLVGVPSISSTDSIQTTLSKQLRMKDDKIRMLETALSEQATAFAEQTAAKAELNELLKEQDYAIQDMNCNIEKLQDWNISLEKERDGLLQKEQEQRSGGSI